MMAEEEDPLGLPLQEELMPLSQSLITPTLSFIFRINFDPKLALDDASEAGSLGRLSDLGSLESGDADFPRLRGGGLLRSSPASGFRLKGDAEDGRKRKSGGKEEEGEEEEEEEVVEELDSESESELGRGRWVENNATTNNNNSSNEEGAMARTLKRPRLVWTPQLHKRFVDAVHHLGIKNAVPKTIMQLMNVDGLTRENVASHLQKYRLYLKRIRLPLSHSKNPLAPIPAPAFLAPPLSPFQFAPAPSTQHFGGFPLPSSSSSLLPSNTLFLSQQECVKKDDENSPQPQLLTFFPTKGC